MLLRLVPPAPLPTILFTLSFPTLPQSLPLPAAWENHLQLLVHYQLTAPPSLHALDKSVAWTALLETVTFDLVTLTVTCVFVDGVQEEWPLTNRCVDLLESVIRDVNRSATEAEIEYELERRKTDVDFKQHSSSNSHTSLTCSESVSEHSTPIAPQKVQKPKKRRSILASLMASLVPSSPFSSFVAPYRSSTPPPPPPPPPSPIVMEDPPEPLVTNGVPASRFLRRRARSTLVDAYRRFVVGELGARFRTGDPAVYNTSGAGFKMHGIDSGISQTPRYALWVTRSTMRSVAEEMARVIEHALFASQGRGRDRDAEQDAVRYTEKFKEDERNREDDRDGDDSGSASSTTDDSSVHTPLDSHDAPFPYNQPSSSQSKYRASPSHTPTVMTPQTYHAYVSLKEMHHRLHSIACQLTAETAAQEQAAAAEAGGAEVRSKRRAWSSRQYLAGCGSPFLREEGGRRGALGGASMALIGLAVPVRSSPLCRGWSAEELEADELGAREGGMHVRWEKGVEHSEMVRRARSLCAEQSQRRRCYFGATGNSCDAEAVPGLGRIRSRALNNVNAEEGPFGLVYSTGPGSRHHRADLHDEVLEEDEDENDAKHADEDEDGGDALYEKRSEKEFILQEPSTLTRPWMHSHVKTPQPAAAAVNKAAMANDLRRGGSIPIEPMLSTSFPTAAVTVEDFCMELNRLPVPDSVYAVDI